MNTHTNRRSAALSQRALAAALTGALLTSGSGCGSKTEPAGQDQPTARQTSKQDEREFADADRYPTLAINMKCPRSGKPVAADSLTEYRGFTVGFCNTHCRDDFRDHISDRPDDRAVFDPIIDERIARDSEQFQARVTGVVDAVRMEIQRKGHEPITVRLSGIDPPHDAMLEELRLNLSDLVGQTVVVVLPPVESPETIADLYPLPGERENVVEPVSLTLVKHGFARSRSDAIDVRLEHAEAAAREQKLGTWAVQMETDG